jgi:hypothetical protein
MVTGASISAPKRPVATPIPSERSASTNRRTSGSSGGARSARLGRLPFRVSGAVAIDRRFGRRCPVDWGHSPRSELAPRRDSAYVALSLVGGRCGEDVVVLVGASHLGKPRREGRELQGLFGLREDAAWAKGGTFRGRHTTASDGVRRAIRRCMTTRRRSRPTGTAPGPGSAPPQTSRTIVTGPSLISSTSMYAPKTPVST